MKLQKSIFVFVSALLILAACSKKDTSTPAPTYKQPSIAAHTEITVPAGLQTQANSNSYAGVAASFMTMANGLSAFAADFAVPDGATKQNLKSNGTVYFWTYSGYSYWMTYKQLSDKYTWTYDWQTPDINRFTFISAEELKTGAAGNWKIYSPEGTNAVVWDYNWTLASSIYNATMNFYEEGGTTAKFTVLDNGNNSGNFKYFDGEVKKVDITWNSDGTGTWWFTDGSTVYSGSWTAAGK